MFPSAVLITSCRDNNSFRSLLHKAIEEPFVAAVKETLGERFSSSMEKIYRRTINFILQVLILGFKYDIDESSNPTTNTGYV